MPDSIEHMILLLNIGIVLCVYERLTNEWKIITISHLVSHCTSGRLSSEIPGAGIKYL